MSLHRKNIDIVNYTSKLDTIAITPIIEPQDVIKEALCKECKQISLRYRFANICLHIDYEDYISSDIIQKKYLILENILKSLLLIKRRLGNDFDYEASKKDIIDLLHKRNFI